MTEREFRLPDLGEGLEEARILAWLVAEGDEVALNQPFVEVETAKADIEIPSPFAGRVTQLHAAVGDAVPVGAPLVTIDAAEAGGGPVAATPAVRKLARELGVNVEGLTGTGPEGRAFRQPGPIISESAPYWLSQVSASGVIVRVDERTNPWSWVRATAYRSA